jgi:hypothetical protein
MILTKAKVAPQGKLNTEDLKKMGMNVLVFTAPALIVFFGQLASGVNWKVAGAVALLALWGILADLFKKLQDGAKK